jgi:hypothetical protein
MSSIKDECFLIIFALATFTEPLVVVVFVFFVSLIFLLLIVDIEFEFFLFLISFSNSIVVDISDLFLFETSLFITGSFSLLISSSDDSLIYSSDDSLKSDSLESNSFSILLDLDFADFDLSIVKIVSKFI